MNLRTKLAAGTLALLTPIALAGCGGGSGDSATTSASSSASAAQSAGNDLWSVETGKEVDKNTLVDTMSKGMQDARTYHMNMDVDVASGASASQKMTLTGDVDMSTPASPKMQLKMNLPAGQGGSLDMVIADGSVYMKMPAAGSKYIKLSLAEMAKMSGQDLSSLMDPTGQIEKQKNAITSAVYQGEEDVNGTKTRHFKLTLDPRTAMGTAVASLPSSAGLPATMPYDVWLDDKGRTHKLAMDMAMAGATVKVSGIMSKFGEPVTVAVPPSSQVTTLPAGAMSSVSK